MVLEYFRPLAVQLTLRRRRDAIELADKILEGLRDDREVREQALGGRSLVRVGLKKGVDDFFEINGDLVSLNRGVSPRNDELLKPLRVGRLEWQLESDHLVQNDAERPHVGLARVGLRHPNLGRHEVRRAQAARRHVAADVEFAALLRQTKVADFDEPQAGQQDVRRFQVAVDDVVPMQIFHGQEKLDEEEEDGIFEEESFRSSSSSSALVLLRRNRLPSSRNRISVGCV